MTKPSSSRVHTAEASKDLNAPLERVWALLTDLSNAPRWHPTWRTVDILETARRGTAFGLSAPLPGNAWVTRFEPPSALEILYFPHLTGLRLESHFDLLSLGPDRTRVTLASSASGLMASFVSGRAQHHTKRVLIGLERALGGQGSEVSNRE
jgi:uncharacterized protein YndB with AHSA1/START domain